MHYADDKFQLDQTTAGTLDPGFANRLKRVRLHLGLSQKDMDALLGLGTKSWQRYESGGVTPGSQVLAALARQGVNAQWLLTGVGDMVLHQPRSPRSAVSDARTEYGAACWVDKLVAAGPDVDQALDALMTESVIETAVQLAEEQIEARGCRLSPKDRAKYLATAILIYQALPADQRDEAARRLFATIVDLCIGRAADDSAAR